MTNEQLTQWVQLIDWDTSLSTADEISQLRRMLVEILPALTTPLTDALENSNSLLAAILLEKRPDEEIEAQITENRTLLSEAGCPKH